ncbi:hypothetical protein MLD38_001008 [Melastoma candidum]|uniref:Uncharacterized protein n=1 Tax=Melastoma candidum TaxID=119954 RepID=A0ACB9SDG3_9MYRT|nr:hypothetical protein MLD38_001008 [Melastoma candidum]
MTSSPRQRVLQTRHLHSYNGTLLHGDIENARIGSQSELLLTMQQRLNGEILPVPFHQQIQARADGLQRQTLAHDRTNHVQHLNNPFVQPVLRIMTREVYKHALIELTRLVGHPTEEGINRIEPLRPGKAEGYGNGVGINVGGGWLFGAGPGGGSGLRSGGRRGKSTSMVTTARGGWLS